MELDSERAEFVQKLKEDSGVDCFSDVFFYDHGFAEWMPTHLPESP